MVAWVSVLYAGVKAWVQITKRPVKLYVIVHVCHPSFPILGWETEKGECLKTLEPSSLPYATMIKGHCLKESERGLTPDTVLCSPRNTQQSAGICTLTQMCTHTNTYTYVSYTHIMHRHVYKIYNILAKATFSYVKHRTALHIRLVMKKKEWRQIPQEVLWETCVPYVWTRSCKERDTGNWSIFVWITIN